MAEYTFNTPNGQEIPREQLAAYVNTGEKGTPVWSPMGRHVESSNAEYDWSEDVKQDILGNTYGEMKTPKITQDFDPWPLDGGDVAQKHFWELAVVKHDAQALKNQDLLIVHTYANFAERYDGSMVVVKNFGGDGGSTVGMSTTVTYGGTRTIGTATVSNGKVTFTPEDGE